jgi:ubiquinone/menaquinone biosynthesis C-methylase UbiE
MEPVDYDALAGDYAQYRKVDPAVLERLMCDLEPASRVLEVGCGTGNYAAELAARVGCEAVGIDPSAEMVVEARSRDAALTVIRAPAEQLPHAGPFDLAFCVDVVHHLDDRPRAFGEVFRELRPGGRLCIVTDSESVIRQREPLAVFFPETVAVELARYPRIATLRRELRDAGFVDPVEDLSEHVYELASADAYRHRVHSSLLFIDDEAFVNGLARLEAALKGGPLQCTSRYVLLWATKAASPY